MSHLASQSAKGKLRDNLWEIVNYLWLKYVGISEEYELLREKWMFLKDAHPPAIPIGKGSQIFKALDKSIARSEKLFRRFGFDKKSLDDYARFRECDYRFCEEIETELFGLVTYVGLLKLAYFQRTVSYEVVHSTGFAYGPEKTIGSEMVYVAADNIVESYSDCVETKRRQPGDQPVFLWDNFATFVPPIQSPGFFGAVCTTFPLGLFHISLSEEQKSQIPPLLMIAHEIAHVSVRDPDKVSNARIEFESVMQYVILHARNIVRGFMNNGLLYNWYRCPYCPLNILSWSYDDKRIARFFEEIFADFLAYKIGGSNTIEALLDEGSGDDSVRFRTSVVSGYMHELGRVGSQRGDAIDLRIDDVNRRRNTSLRRIASKLGQHLGLSHPLIRICPKCQVVTGQTIGICIKSFEDQHPQTLSKFIKSGKEFSISRKEEKRVISQLLKGIPQTGVDPRKLLHCYFEAFKKTRRIRNRPRYLVTLYSLAFNES
jgi:hypothetical protein